MKRYNFILLFFFLLVFFTVESRADETIVQDYVIGPGDVIEISVWKDEALTKQVVVLPDGKIDFPLVSQIQAGGKTIPQLKSELEKKLKSYMSAPEISAVVKQTNSMVIYVLGKVNNPGRFPINTNVNVLQALALAGGLNPFAKDDKIKIVRDNQGKAEIFAFDYGEVIKNTNLKKNIRLKRGDLVLVP